MRDVLAWLFRAVCPHAWARRAFFFFGLAAGIAPFVKVAPVSVVLRVNGVDLSQYVVDPKLTAISVRYAEQAERYIADKVFPHIGVTPFTWDLEGKWD